MDSEVFIIDEAAEKEFLKKAITTNPSKCIGIFEKFSAFSRVSTLLQSEFLDSEIVMKKVYDTGDKFPSFGILGFSDKEDIDKLADDINARTLFAFPVMRHVPLSTSFKTPMPSNTPCLNSVCKAIISHHPEGRDYSFSAEARGKIINFYDGIAQKQNSTLDPAVYTSYSKSPGHVARIACALCCLRQALRLVVYREESTKCQWSCEISSEDVSAAITLVKQFLDIKFKLLNKTISFEKGQDEKGQNEKCQIEEESQPFNYCSNNSKRPRLDLKISTPSPKLKDHADFQDHQVFSNYNDSQNRSLLIPPIVKETPIRCQRGPKPPHVELLSATPDEYFAGLTHEEFWQRYAGRIKRLLEWKQDRVLPSTVAQRHLVPPLSRATMETLNTSTKYPVAMCKEYLYIVCELGFGTMQDNFTNNNTRRSIYFQKRPYNELSASAKNILNELKVSQVDYNAAFVGGSMTNVTETNPKALNSRFIAQASAVDMPVFPQLQIAVSTTEESTSSVSCEYDTEELTVKQEQHNSM